MLLGQHLGSKTMSLKEHSATFPYVALCALLNFLSKKLDIIF
ncbi:hypothetical protein LEP1GSC087_2281 [Leptospira interrogans serovar Bataviae str. L1111]|nr:hypothetical protein LEP1GSC087_2281 [Leptospira interrogans serovar Bataviae str. L1111]